jgi:lipopolysaccharide transport system ATP-binding protein
MSEYAIRVENLGKLYRIGQTAGYKMLRDSLMSALSAPFRRSVDDGGSGQKIGGSSNTIWALKDVSFVIKPGEVVGIIGSNGAGKSTLLKILSRITMPTTGKIEIFGRVGSLLEVGTGFHPELSGKENIYLNGAVLGMKRREVDQKFDAIVEFSGVRRFLDTPVKHYSSGMYVRLAFAVAAHLETQILIVDEVLAVGDVAFQKKCLGMMNDVAGTGRTVLFVSHNMNAISSMCRRTILLNQGTVEMDSNTPDVLRHYLGANTDRPAESA